MIYDKQGPNILGFLLGIVQMTLYIFYKWCNSKIGQDSNHDETSKESNHDDTSQDLKLQSVDNVIKDNQQVELQIV